jgi:2-acylglycerol O-acyltransferase 2
VVGKRFGFVKLALQCGASLVPCYAFGENDIFDQHEQTEWSKKINAWTHKAYGATFPLFFGRGVFTYNVGVLPYRRPINVVVGKPIDLPKIANPTEEDVKMWHERYLEGIRDIWDNYKQRFALQRRGTLRFMGKDDVKKQ